MRLAARFSLGCLGFLVLAGMVYAQSFFGSITGTVTDTSGARVPAAAITLTSTATGVRQTSKSNSAGNYYFGGLSPGIYLVAVTKEGFKETTSTNITLLAQQTARFDAILEVGQTTQAIQVKAAPPTINTENGRISDTLSRTELLNLPLNNRSSLNFIMLSSSNYQGDGSSYSLGGARGTSTNFTIDGVTSNSTIFGGQVGPMTQESFDSVSEIKTMVSNNSAEYPGAGTLLISSRSGTNQLHGSLFYYHSNNALNARSFFSAERPKGPILHNFGGSIGGPVVIPHLYNGHDRTFFYFTYERQDFPGEYSSAGNVPTLKMRSGDFSDLLPGTQIIDPITGNPFPGNIIPASRISPVAQKMQNFGYPAPNFGSASDFNNNWVGLFVSADHDTRYVTRVDHNISPKDSLSARVSLRSAPEPIQYDTNIPTFQHTQGRSTQNMYLSETHTFGPTMLNEFRVGFSRDASNLQGVHSGAQLLQQFGLQGVPITDASLTGVPSINFNNFAGWFEFPTYFWRSQTWEFLDNLTFIKGKHTIKTGVLFRHNYGNYTQCCNSDFGTLTFDGYATGFDYADFLLGLPHTTEVFVRSQPTVPLYTNLGLFIQDDFQVSSKLTLNLGLRWDYSSPPADKYGLNYNFDPQTGNIVLASQQSQKLVSPLFPSSIPLVTANQAGFPTGSTLEKQLSNLGPRLGFAYRPFGNSLTVIRGAYGIYYTPLVYTRMWDFGGGPFVSDQSFTSSMTNGVPSLQFPNPFTGVGQIPTQNVAGVAKNLRTPTVQQWNLTVQHQFPGQIVATVTYRGMHTTQLPYSGDINKPYPSADPSGENFFRYPNFYSVGMLQDGGIQNLNALDVAVDRRFSSGISFHSGWTYARNLTDTTPDGEGTDNNIQNPYNRAAEYGNVDYMPRHRWVSYLEYQLPYGRGERFGPNTPKVINAVLGNWGVSTVTLFQSGLFLTPSFSALDPSNTRTFGGRPDQVGSWQISNPTIQQWFNPSAFAVPPNGRYGNAANGMIVGPGLANVDFGLFKYFKIKEQVTGQFRVTATNFLNHPNFGNPNTNISSSNVGTITSTQGRKADTLGGGARTIQLGLRFDF